MRGWRPLAAIVFAIAVATVVSIACTPAEQASVLSAAESMAYATGKVLAYAKDAGIEPDEVLRASVALGQENYATAVPLLRDILEKAAKVGHVPDAETQVFLNLAEQVVAVQSLQDGLRAVSQ